MSPKEARAEMAKLTADKKFMSVMKYGFGDAKKLAQRRYAELQQLAHPQPTAPAPDAVGLSEVERLKLDKDFQQRLRHNEPSERAAAQQEWQEAFRLAYGGRQAEPGPEAAEAKAAIELASASPEAIRRLTDRNHPGHRLAVATWKECHEQAFGTSVVDSDGGASATGSMRAACGLPSN